MSVLMMTMPWERYLQVSDGTVTIVVILLGSFLHLTSCFLLLQKIDVEVERTAWSVSSFAA